MAAPSAQAHAVTCTAASLQDTLARLERGYHEKPVGLGTAQSGALLVLTVTENGDGWSIVAALPDGRTCVLESGHNWEAVKSIFGPGA